MTFKGLVIQSSDSSYTGKQGRIERQQLTCLDAETVKLKNTVDVILDKAELAKIVGDPLNQTVTFDVRDIDIFSGRIRFVAVVKIQAAAK